MKRYFPLDNTHNKLLKEIGNTIKEYYPIGVNPSSPEYHEFSGIKKRAEIMWDNIGVNKNYKKTWVSFIKKVGKASEKKVESTTYGSVPGFSADMLLEEYQDVSLIRIRRIAFAVSLLGPFFSICGVDQTVIKEEGIYGYDAINVVTASPYKEFEGDFNGIRKLIQEKFPDYNFVPFDICMMQVENMRTPDSLGQDCTVYEALFNHLFRFYTHYRSRGDSSYGFEKSTNIKITLTAPPQNNNSRNDEIL